MLIHKSDAASFAGVVGKKIEYAGYRDLKQGLAALLKGVSSVAMEYAPKSGIASLTRVDAGTVDLVRKSGVDVRSSANLVQFTKSLWGPDGRVAHYLASHHLTKMRQEAFDFIAEHIRSSRPVTEYDVQRFLQEGARVRGLRGFPVVSTGVNTANPRYQAKKSSASSIKKGDLVVISLAGAVADADRPIYAASTWVGFVGETVPERFHRAFETISQARDASIALIEERIKRRRPVKGFEVDQKARNVVGQGGLAANFLHRTGHSLDTSLNGDGANLDDYETHDTRTLVVGSGFTVGPGVYKAGDFGVRTEVGVHLARGGVEVTGPLQKRIQPILATR
jgi:Xaa-Pro aminopeptidase